MRNNNIDQESLINQGLRKLTKLLTEYGFETYYGLGGDDGYGVIYQNDTFGMHPYCWCESQDCPWCISCTCPDDASKYFINDREVSIDEYVEDRSESKYKIEKSKDKICLYCREELLPAPNFWHIKSGSKIYWYKYIGRSMKYKVNGDINKIIEDCINSITIKNNF